MTQISGKVQTQPDGGEDYPKARVFAINARLKEAGGKSVGRRTGIPCIREGSHTSQNLE